MLISPLSSRYPLEADVWSTMECFARICVILIDGDPPIPEHERQPIVHLDIRPESSKLFRFNLQLSGLSYDSILSEGRQIKKRAT